MKKVSLLLVFVFAALTISAQESGTSSEAGRKTTFKKNGFWDNWFIGVGAGANVYFGDYDKDADFFSRPTVAPILQFGTWHNPYLGFRAKLTGGSLHHFGPDATVMAHQKYVGGELNVLWNVSNYLGRYNENRFYSFIPYAGVGAYYGWDYKVNDQKVAADNRTWGVNAGIINNFRLSNKLSLAIELSGSIVKEQFDRKTGGDWDYDAIGTASASLVYKLGKVGFSEAVLLDQGLIDDLNGQINKLRQENAKLAKRPESCPTCPEAKTIVKEVAVGSFKSNVVVFRLGSANIDKNQDISIYNTAQYLKDNPNAKVTVTGYADKKTGTASINDRLSEKRAKNVANALINKYNISSDRVAVEWKGDTVQPFAENAWNRVAIVVAD